MKLQKRNYIANSKKINNVAAAHLEFFYNDFHKTREYGVEDNNAALPSIPPQNNFIIS
jgi:hypothetical protein